MALKSTIHKADLQISNMDRAYYQSHQLTIAKHPSETDERMMMRLLAFALYADERLLFGNGISTDDEPDLWLKDRTGAIDLWIDVGLPDEREIRKACGRAKQVVLIAYGGRTADMWWKQNASTLTRQKNLTLLNIDNEATTALAALSERNMQLSCTIEDEEIWLASATASIQIAPIALMSPAVHSRQ